jgi:hypothetical protein
VAIVGGLSWFWGLRGRVAEGRQLAVAALERGTEVSLARARGLVAAGWLARLQGDLEAGAVHHAASVRVLEQLDDPVELGKAMVWNAEAASSLGDWEAARSGWADAVELLAPLGPSQPLAYAHLELAIAYALAGDSARVRSSATEGMRLMQVVGNPRGAGVAELCLVHAAMLESDYAEARRHLGAGVRHILESGAGADLVWPLELGAWLLEAEGEHRRAVVVSAAAMRHREATQRTATSDSLTRGYGEALEQARGALTYAEFAEAQAIGDALEPAAAIEMVGLGVAPQ